MKKRIIRAITLLLLMGMTMGLCLNASAAGYVPAITANEASNITSKGAQLNAYVSCAQRLRYDNVGFYLSSNKNDLNAHRFTTSYAPKTASFTLSFTTSQVKSLYGALNEGTIYYYKLFVVVNGEEYASGISWFRTADDATQEKKGTPSFSVYDAAEITMNSALLRASINTNALGLTFSKVGLLMGVSPNALSEVASNVPASSSLPQMAYYVSQYKTLSPLTTYYYQFYAMTKSGASYVSAVKSFTTLAPYHTVTFQPNGGMLTQMGAMIVYPGQPYAFTEVPVRDGYSFAGWYTLPNGGSRVSETGIWMYDADVTLYAMWTQGGVVGGGSGTLLVYFDQNHDNLGVTESKSVTYGNKYGSLPEPTRTGYSFAGWYTAKENGSRVKSSTKVSGAGTQVLYAAWTPQGTRVKFSANGGAVNPGEAKLSYGVSYTLPVPTRSGYAFTGWNTKKDGSGSTVLSDTPWAYNTKITLYAQWSQLGAGAQGATGVALG